MNDFAPKLGITDKEELQKAINYLGDRGFIILASFDMVGGISAAITTEGSIYVETGGETGMIKQYRRSSQASIRVPSEPSPSTEAVKEEKGSSPFARRAVEAILEDMEDVLERDDTVGAEVKKDLISDLATLKIQMERNVKNRQIINVVLANLSSIPSIAPFVTGLNCIIDAYFR